MTVKVAIVSRDDAVRAAAARAFESAPAHWTVRLHADEPVDADVVVHGSDLREGGGIVFDPERPDGAVHAVQAIVGAGRVYLVAAAVGGAGATTIALHLAAALAPACCAELAGPSARLGLPDDVRTWSRDEGDRSLLGLPVAGGFHVLRSPDPPPPPESFPLEEARAAHDRLVLDAGARRDVGPVLPSCHAALVVTTPTRPSALAARDLVEAFPETRWIVVVNRLGPGGQIMRGGLEQLLGRRVGIELPCCPALRDAEDQARLLRGTWRRWTRGVARLAGALESC